MELTGTVWRKSTRSSQNGGACVEVSDSVRGCVLVRDSKDPHGGTLAFSPGSWRMFLARVARHADGPTARE
ncbi:DUF397 domain-containing protein [Micromonospora inyonensis]|uniref:DUF397 domain-containing protein n=1 Tax=Micromonospora inyonensis TaxID=47866 RepID=A0A1C6RBT6_9ACTN|nr:DUF397 domain-containing protein [Micromonospora inyonensis]SCL14537.1 protein of unknown function [Micromonospora inyonensis]